MKGTLLFLVLIIGLAVNAQKVYVDSIDFAAITGADTIIYPDLGRVTLGALLSVELEFTTLNNDDAYFAPGWTNKGNTFNMAGTVFGMTADSVQMDTAVQKRIVNGYVSGSGYSYVSTGQNTMLICGEKSLGKYFGMYFRKGSVTAGKVYYYITKL